MRRAELERPLASPRSARLRELEVDPPQWLVEAIGRAPTFNKSSARPVLAWRRAALAIDDYRNEAGWHSKEVGVGPTPIQPDARRAHERARKQRGSSTWNADCGKGLPWSGRKESGL